MAIGASKIGLMGGLVPGGSCTFNASGTFVVPPGVRTISTVSACGGTGNPGNPGNSGTVGTAGNSGCGGGGGNGAFHPWFYLPSCITAYINTDWREGTGTQFGRGGCGGCNPSPGVGAAPNTQVACWLATGGTCPTFGPYPPGPSNNTIGVSRALDVFSANYNFNGPPLYGRGSTSGVQATSGGSGTAGSAGTAGTPGNAGTAGTPSTAFGFTFPGGTAGTGGNAGTAGAAGTGGTGGPGGTPGTAGPYVQTTFPTPEGSGSYEWSPGTYPGGAGGTGGGSGGCGTGVYFQGLHGGLSGGGGGGAGETNSGSSGGSFLNEWVIPGPQPAGNPAASPGNAIACGNMNIPTFYTISGHPPTQNCVVNQPFYFTMNPQNMHFNNDGGPTHRYITNQTDSNQLNSAYANYALFCAIQRRAAGGNPGGGQGGAYGFYSFGPPYAAINQICGFYNESNHPFCARCVGRGCDASATRAGGGGGAYFATGSVRASGGGGGGGGRGNAGNSGGSGGAGGAGNPGAVGSPFTCTCIPVVPGASCPVVVGSGGRVTICWNPQ